MSQCKKFAPNIFHKTKCSNCFRQKEEHSAEALECNRASRSVARSGYLFVAPDWDFSVPLNRTKRWQRRWFVLYDDGELNYSVDEHPDTIPQGSVDMSKVMEVTAAEQITGHPHSVALTSPDRVTFIKAASREDARWWVELLAMFPRRHKRNATFPGGRASPSLPQLGRSASPQPPRPRLLSCTTSGPSPRTNFETPPLKEERESPPKDDQRPKWLPQPTKMMPIEVVSTPIRNEYAVSSGSPPTRDKLRCEDKARARRDWRNERLRDIATALTDRSPESSLALPAEGLLHLKKGWLWLRNPVGEWVRRWIVLCLPTLNIYHGQDEQATPEHSVELSLVTSYNEVITETKYAFDIHWSGQTVTLSAVTAGIRGNWLEALKKSCPATPTPSDSSTTPTTPRSSFLSSDDEYKTASENDRRFSGDWSELPPSPPLTKFTACRLKDRARVRSRLCRGQSRQNTVDSTSTDELDSVRETEHVELSNTLNKQNLEIHDLQGQLSKVLRDKGELEEEIARLKKFQSEAMTYEKKTKDRIANFEKNERELNQRNSQTEMKFTKDLKTLQHQLIEAKEATRKCEEKVGLLSRELQTKQHIILGLQENLSSANEKYMRILQENEQLNKTLQELESRCLLRNPNQADSLASLTDINLEIDIEELGTNELKEYALDLRSRFERSILEIRAIKRRLREADENFDRLEIVNFSLEESMKLMKNENEEEVNLLIIRLEHLTSKLSAVEKQLRGKSKTEQREKRRSLSLKGRESYSINREVEDKVTELEAKIVALEKGGKPRRKHKRDRSGDRSSPIDDKSLRRLRRKSLDSATASEPLKLLMRLSTLESKVTNINVSTESLNVSNSVSDLSKIDEQNKKLDSTKFENIILEAKSKLCECLCQINNLQSNRNKRSSYPNGEKVTLLERCLNELGDILNYSSNIVSSAEIGVIQCSADSVVKQFENILIDKLTELYEKKRLMIENNNYDSNARLHYLAEKVSFENIMIGRIQEAFNIATNGEASCDRLINKEIRETAHLINSLKSKFNGKNLAQAPKSRTSADYLSKILAKALISVTHGFKNFKKHFSSTQPSLHILIDEQKKLESQLSVYKSIKLPQLADTLASETMHLITDKGCILKSITNETKHHFTQATREKVNVELMQAEINHVLLKAAQVYQSNLNSDSNYFFSFFASERAALELWADSVEDYLYDEISKNINELTELYQNSLNKLQRQNWRRKLESERMNHSSSTLLNEFADIVAHKALIDARINVLSGKFDAHLIGRNAKMDNILNTLINSEECWSCLENQPVQLNQSLEAEFLCMIDKYSKDCYALVERPEVETVLGYLNDISSEIVQLQHQASLPVNASIFRDWKDVCSKCSELRDRLIQIRMALKNSSTSLTNLDSSNIQRPVYLGAEYLSQVESLRSAYRCVLASCKDSHQESDIEQLKLLCERVLVAMEQWHHRTIQEMREKHAQEIELLQQEKEQALKEETQATLAALDAMRKAHQAEVQREVAKFKQDFARQQRDEVLELSDKLSVKRLEAAALSEQLGSASRQLAHAQQHILALERNPQLAKFQN